MGEQHLETAETLHDFAVFQQEQGKYPEAASLYQRVLVIRERILGAEHPKTIDSRERLGKALVALERIEETGKPEKAQPEPTKMKDVEKSEEMRGELCSVLPSCPYCQRDSAVVKSGTNKSGSQRWRCQNCHHYFTPQSMPRGYERAWKEQAVLLAAQGKSYRSIARQLGVNHRTIRAWITVNPFQTTRRRTLDGE